MVLSSAKNTGNVVKFHRPEKSIAASGFLLLDKLSGYPRILIFQDQHITTDGQVANVD